MAGKKYYGLVSGLPWLPHFDQAEYNPVTSAQMSSRLMALTEKHRAELDAAASLMAWSRQPRERELDQLVQRYGRAMTTIDDPALRGFVEFRMGLRTVVVALRTRCKGESPAPGSTWGVGRWTRKIASNWDEPDFRMGSVYPWIGDARLLLEKSDALGLERLLLEAIWKELNIIEGRTAFGFERVFAFVFKWDIVRRWLTYDANVATDRFQTLIKEVIRDHEQLFA